MIKNRLKGLRGLYFGCPITGLTSQSPDSLSKLILTPSDSSISRLVSPFFPIITAILFFPIFIILF
ncbi:unnamed protein product, partial [marine sediment metagenome]